MLQGFETPTRPEVLIGPAEFDDAGVIDMGDGQLLVQTVDFFPPIVDDPESFGRIAAANSLSDIYAMGATPFCALNIVGFPAKKLDLEILRRILDGGAEKMREAEVALLGGHSVEDAEIKYGLAVTGRVDRAGLRSNVGAQPGDAVVLTKPLGMGALSTGLKARKAALRGSEAAREIFGSEFVDHYATTREWEEREFRKHITDWELARYFEII